MLCTEEIVRANIRNRDGKRVYFLGKGDTLTPGARDFLTRERIQLRPAQEAKLEEYRLLSGGRLREKPEELTHLRGDILIHKTHPVIAFRGAMDTLEGELLLAQLTVTGEYRRELGEILDYARRMLRCDVMEEELKQERLCGLTEEELRLRSHRPQEFYGQSHFMPSAEDGPAILQVNRARCAARAAELAAVRAFCDREGIPTRVDLLRGLNRMSSMLWILMIRLKKEINPTG